MDKKRMVPGVLLIVLALVVFAAYAGAARSGAPGEAPPAAQSKGAFIQDAPTPDAANNVVSPFDATVSGGSYNVATAAHSTVSGGSQNTASVEFAVVGGGYRNTASATRATVGGGYGNTASHFDVTIGGGGGNTASGKHATIGGGSQNSASGFDATIAGGSYNSAANTYATVGGGSRNDASGFGSWVGGGAGNRANAQHAGAGGGLNNLAGGVYATVAGGYANTAEGAFSTVSGGGLNQAAGDYSTASGYQAQVDAAHDGAFLHADASDFPFTSAAPNEFAVRATGGVRLVSGIDATGAPVAGVTLPPGSGTWASLSDSEARANVAPVDTHSILTRLAELPIATWNYTSQDPAIRHIGPAAQDFHDAFGFGDSEKYISALDADGVNLAAIQALYELLQQKDAQIAALEARVSALEDALAQP